jgi:hypothetical protein
MSRYISFIKLKHLIFLNKGSISIKSIFSDVFNIVAGRDIGWAVLERR